MKHECIFIVGGAGFLGYHTSLELVRRGARVTALAVPAEVVDESLASQVTVVRADVDTITDDELAALLEGHDAIVYAAGPDDRVELPVGVAAADFFGTQLVDRTERVLRVAKDSGVSKAIIYGSYFSYINNRGLCGIRKGQLERHPYIRARVEQSRRVFALGSDQFSVVVLNIPYVFGTAPGKEPIWKRIFIERFADQSKIIYGGGGSTVLTPTKIAVATAQALELATHGEELALGSVDMKYTPMIRQLLAAANIHKSVAEIPGWLLGLFMKIAWRKEHKAGRDSGLDLRYLASDILNRDLFIDYKATDQRLLMQDYVDDVTGAIIDTGQRIRE